MEVTVLSEKVIKMKGRVLALKKHTVKGRGMPINQQLQNNTINAIIEKKSIKEERLTTFTSVHVYCTLPVITKHCHSVIGTDLDMLF